VPDLSSEKGPDYSTVQEQELLLGKDRLTEWVLRKQSVTGVFVLESKLGESDEPF